MGTFKKQQLLGFFMGLCVVGCGAQQFAQSGTSLQFFEDHVLESSRASSSMARGEAGEWFSWIPDDQWPQELKREIDENFNLQPVDRRQSQTTLRHPAARRITTHVAIPLDLDYDRRVPAHYKSDEFSIDFGDRFAHAPLDPFRNVRLARKGKLRCEATFASLRSSFRVSGQSFAPLKQDYDHWQCSDLILLPDQISDEALIDKLAADEFYGNQCGQLLQNAVAGLVLRHCTQVKRAAHRAPYQRTFVLGPFRSQVGTSFVGSLAQHQETYKNRVQEYRRELSAGFQELREDFRKAEFAYDRLYKSLPVSAEGRQMMAQHFAISTFALATAGMELSLWKELLLGGGVFAAIGAGTELLGEQRYLEAGGEWLGFSATLSLVDRKMTDHVNHNLQLRAKATGQAVKLSPSSAHVISALAYVIAVLVVDYFKGELNKGRYAHDITITEDIAERITMAAIAVGTYVLSAKFGPLGGILRSELTMLYYEFHALGRYAYFMGQAEKQNKKWGQYVSARHFAGVNDFEVIMASYGRYLQHLSTTKSPDFPLKPGLAE